MPNERENRAPGDPAPPEREEREALAAYVRIAEEIPGWIRGAQAEALAHASLALPGAPIPGAPIPGAPIIVQIGTFFGSAAVLLAGARKIKGAGKLYCVDPFDCSGDDFSVPYYQQLLAAAGSGSLRDHFEHNIRRAGLDAWVEVLQGRAEDFAPLWSTPIDMLALGGDQSPAGARAAYECWAPFLRPGGTIAVHNSAPGPRPEGHSGNRRIAVEEIVAPAYADISLVVATTFARRAG